MQEQEFIEIFFAIFILGAFALYFCLGGILVEWQINRRHKQDVIDTSPISHYDYDKEDFGADM